jgi:hypothetical protein
MIAVAVFVPAPVFVSAMPASAVLVFFLLLDPRRTILVDGGRMSRGAENDRKKSGNHPCIQFHRILRPYHESIPESIPVASAEFNQTSG